MSNEMIERVALAISEITVHGDFSSDELARAAIEAMREPTDAMLKAPSAIMGGGFQNSHSDRETWEAMIAAALGEQS